MADDPDARREQQAGAQIFAVGRVAVRGDVPVAGRARLVPDDDVHRARGSQLCLRLGAGQVLVAVDDDRYGMRSHQFGEGRQRAVGQIGVEDDGGGTQLGSQAQQVGAGTCLAEHDEARIDRQDRAHAAAGQRGTAGHQNADLAHLRRRALEWGSMGSALTWAR